MFVSLFNIFSFKKTLTERQEVNLYKEHYKSVFRTIYYYVKNKELAKELTNDAFIIAFDKFDTLNNITKFKSWICVIGKNLAKKYLRKNSNLYFVEDYKNLNIGSANMEDEIIEQIDKEIKLKMLKNALKRIKPQYREVIILKYYEKKSYIEIAKELNISMGTVKSRINRAKRELANEIEIIEKEGVNYVV